MNKLLEKLRALNASQRAIVDKAQAESNRSLTTDEIAEFDKLDGQIKEVKRSIELLEAIEARSKEADEIEKRYNEAPKAPSVTHKRDAKKEFSMARAISLIASGKQIDGAEKDAVEAGRSEARESKIELLGGDDGFMIGSSFLKRDMTATGQTSVAGDQGGMAITTEKMRPMDLLLNELVINRAGATILTGLTGNIDFPKLALGSAPAWETENGDADELSPTLAKVSLSPKRLTCYVEVSKQLIYQLPVIEQIVMSNINRKLAVALDQAAIQGGGSNEPTGILATSGIGAVTSSGSPTFAHIVGLETEVGQDNALNGRLAYLTNSKAAGKLKVTPRISGAAAGFLMEGNQMNGYNAFVSNSVPSNISSTKSAIIFGNFADLVVGQWSGYEVYVDPFSAGKAGKVQIVFSIYVDVAALRAESFAAIQDVATS